MAEERWTIHVCKDCRSLAHCGDRCKKDRRRVWTEMEAVEVVPASRVAELEGALEELLHQVHDACKFNQDTTVRAVLEGVLHRHRYGDRDRIYQGDRCWCPHCKDAYRVWERGDDG